MNPLVPIGLLIGGLAWLGKQREPGKPVRRNLEGYEDEHGFHPIRESEGYDPKKTGEGLGEAKLTKTAEKQPPQIPFVERLAKVGKLWEKAGKRRIYFDDLSGWYGLKTTRYHTGNISSASLDGERISNTTAHHILSALSNAKVWYDFEDSKFHGQGGGDYFPTIVTAIKRAARKASAA